MTHLILNGDCLDELRSIADASVDSVVTDPPYGLSNTKPAQVVDTITRWASGERDYLPSGRGFMGKEWDGFVPPPAVWGECMRVLKPGGHMLVFAGPRTQDLMGLSIRLAGFDIRDSIGWIYGSGFPKSMDVSKSIDKAVGAEREVVGNKLDRPGYHLSEPGKDNGILGGGRGLHVDQEARRKAADITAPATPEAEQWSGWGTALKPAIEPVIVARKPLDGTVAANVLAHGTGGINVDACRVGTDGGGTHCANRDESGKCRGHDNAGRSTSGETFHGPDTSGGRWPANVLLDPEAAAAMDAQSGNLPTQKTRKNPGKETTDSGMFGIAGKQKNGPEYLGDSGGASRFFPVFKYQAKAPAKERPQYTAEDGRVVKHATVKPLALMRWLVRLVTPEGGVVLDPFAGSGATVEAALLEGMSPIGIEREADYIPLIEARIARTLKETP